MGAPTKTGVESALSVFASSRLSAELPDSFSAHVTQTAERLDLYALSRTELGLWLSRAGLKPAHAATIWSALYLDLVKRLDAIEVPAKVRDFLAHNARLGTPATALETDSSDGFTRKYLLSLADAERIETVLMRFSGRVTACLSSQVGCAMGCVFCATGQMGYTRHLTAGEIVAQAVHVARELRTMQETQVAELKTPNPKLKTVTPARLRNVVLMGMGEPLHNYEAVMHATDILRDDGGLAIAAERITLSTVGVVPGILRLAREKRPLHLAVSLHAATQAERAALVPAARRWPLDELRAPSRPSRAARTRAARSPR